MIDEDTGTALVSLIAISNGSEADASMELSIPKTMGMHVHAKKRDITEAEVMKDPNCLRNFPTQRTENPHQALV